MDVKETAERINSNLENYLVRSGIDTGKPFRCLNPSHEDIHPSMVYSRRTNRCRCFACGVTYDLIDIIGIAYNKPGRKEAFKQACELYRFNKDAVLPKKAEARKQAAAKDQDYSEFFAEANRHLRETDYHRGISLRTLDRFNCGYEAKWRHPKSVAEGKNPPVSPRLIIPTGPGSYVARDTRNNLTERQNEFKKQKVGRTHIFNADALRTADRPVFIVEGEIDAMSVIDVGGIAVGLGSISMVSRFLELVKELRPVQPMIIALDNEPSESVKKAEERLLKGLQELGIKAAAANPCGKYKDANEALNADRAGFADAVYLLEKSFAAGL